jgi:hypothetical protein
VRTKANTNDSKTLLVPSQTYLFWLTVMDEPKASKLLRR